MRRLSEIRGEDALDVIADLIDPVSEICTDEEFVGRIRERKKLDAAKVALKNHKSAILAVLAVWEGVDVEEYNPSLIEIPGKILQILNDPDIISVFRFAEPGRPSGSATASTGETEGK